SPAGFGQADSSRAPLEKRKMKLFFQQCDSLAHRRLCNSKGRRRGGEARKLGRSDERAKVRKFRGARFAHKATIAARTPGRVPHLDEVSTPPTLLAATRNRR